MRLYLVRHPRPAVAEGVCYGQTDLALAEPVGPIAESLRIQLPKGLPVYSSPLRRCLELAAVLHPAPIVDDRLMEMDFGEWEMQRWDEIDRRAMDAWAADPLGFSPPCGESPASLMRRVGEFCQLLNEESVLITHAGVIKAMTGLVRRMMSGEWIRLNFGFGSITVLELDSGLR